MSRSSVSTGGLHGWSVWHKIRDLFARLPTMIAPKGASSKVALPSAHDQFNEVDPLAGHVGEAVLKDFLLRADHYDSVVGHVVDFDCKRCKSILIRLYIEAPREKQAVLSKRLAA